MPTTDSLAATISNIEVQVAADHNGAIIAAVRHGARVEQPSKPGHTYRFDPFGDPQFPWTDGRDRYATADLPYPPVEVVDDGDIDETLAERLAASRDEDR